SATLSSTCICDPTHLIFHSSAAPPTYIYPLSLTTLFRSDPRRGHIEAPRDREVGRARDRHRVRPLRLRLAQPRAAVPEHDAHRRDRKSTRLNSSHVKISYAVFCLKKKTKT